MFLYKITIVHKKTDEWYIEWQRVTTSGTTSDNEWQRVTANDNEWYNEWQRVTKSDREWQRVVQRVTIPANFPFFSNKTGAYH